MATVFIPSANDPAVFTTDKFPLLKDGDGNTYRTVVKANVNGSVDVYSKGTDSFGGDELLFQYSATRNAANFSVGKFKDKPTTAYNSFFRSSESNGEQFLKDVKTKWYSEAPPNAATRMATLRGYQSIAATTQARQTSNGPSSLTITTGAGTTTIVSPTQSQSNTDGVDPPPKTLQIPEIKSDTKDPPYEDLVYPTGLGDFGQDFITFTAYSYGGRTFSPGANAAETLSLGIGPRNFKDRKGSVSLPIQPSITDSNTVQWGSENLNPITAFLASSAFGAMSNPGKSVNDALEKAESLIKSNENISPALKLYLAGKAVGVNGLLSRIGGGILNPNMELLFQGPQLRPFTFVFRLSAREKTEADTIRKIIRYFKQNMAVKTAEDNLFLKAPNIFEIHYRQGRNKSEDHPSLNRIKKCALQSCNVDYTPDGSYMTFNDVNNTMVSYNLTLQFQELEPVTSRDYKGISIDQIGY